MVYTFYVIEERNCVVIIEWESCRVLVTDRAEFINNCLYAVSTLENEVRIGKSKISKSQEQLCKSFGF